MKVRSTTAGLILPILFVAGILVASALGYWVTEGSKTPKKIGEGAFAGKADPADIRGSYTLADVEKAFDIPVATLAKAFGFADAENPAEIKVKDLEASYGQIGDLEIGTDSMRLFVALYKGIPIEAESGTAIPQPAWSILKKEAATDPETLDKFSKQTVSLESFKDTEQSSSQQDAESEDERVIKGKTLFSELLDWGVTKDQISEVLGIPMGPTGISIRDYCSEKEIEFSSVKETLQELVDKAE